MTAHADENTGSKQLFGKYELLEQIGEGGMAEIYRARASGVQGFEKMVVVKRIRADRAADRDTIKALIEEAKLCASLRHANIVQTFDLGEENGEYFIVMEYVRGMDLLDILKRSTLCKQRVPVPIALFIVAEVAKALSFAHRATDSNGHPLAIVHHDVSPANILISDHGEVKLVDFGVARANVKTLQKVDGKVRGKLGYIPPEGLVGKATDHRADIFALGVVLWEVLTLKRLLIGPTREHTVQATLDMRVGKRFKRYGPIVPADIQSLIQRTVAKDPDERFNDAHAIYDGIHRYLFERRSRVSERDVADFLAHLRIQSPAAAGQDTTSSKVRPRARTSQADVLANKPVAKGSGSEPAASVDALPHKRIHVRRSDSATIFGPVSVDNFKKLIKNRVVGTRELISVDGGPWTQISQSQFIPLLDDPNLVTTLAEGKIAPLVLPKLVGQAARLALTGQLQFTALGTRKEIYFRNGRIISVTSTARDELLAQVMRNHGFIGRAELDRALSYSDRHGGRLGQALTKLGLLRDDEVQRALRLQLEQRFFQLFCWTDGLYIFRQGVAPPNEPTTESFEALPLLLSALRLHYDLKTLESFFPDPSVRLVVNPTANFESLVAQVDPDSTNPYVKLLKTEPRLKDVVAYAADDASRKVALTTLTAMVAVQALITRSDDAKETSASSPVATVTKPAQGATVDNHDTHTVETVPVQFQETIPAKSNIKPADVPEVTWMTPILTPQSRRHRRPSALIARVSREAIAMAKLDSSSPMSAGLHEGAMPTPALFRLLYEIATEWITGELTLADGTSSVTLHFDRGSLRRGVTPPESLMPAFAMRDRRFRLDRKPLQGRAHQAPDIRWIAGVARKGLQPNQAKSWLANYRQSVVITTDENAVRFDRLGFNGDEVGRAALIQPGRTLEQNAAAVALPERETFWRAMLLLIQSGRVHLKA